VHDELLAKALVIDNGDMRIATVTCDLISVSKEIVNAVKARIKERCGIPPECVMVNATHTHSGAGVSNLVGTGDDGYGTWLPLKVADAVELATKRIQSVRVGFASVIEDRISFCRRWRMKNGTVRMNPGRNNPDLVEPVSEIDPELRMMYVESEDGTPISAVANFSLHYVGTGKTGDISADYFGQFYHLMRHYLGGDCVPVLWNAPCAQINNLKISGNTVWRNRGYPQAKRMANVLAGHMITEIQLMEMHDELDLDAATDNLDVRRKVITEEDLQIAEKVLAGRYEYDKGPFSWVVGQPIPEDRVATYARQCQRLAELPEQMTVPLQAIRIGDAGIIALPGEIFVESGFRIKAESSASPLMAVCLANDSIGYICTDEALKEGGYETWAAMSSRSGAGTAPKMEALGVSLLRKVGF